MPLSRQADDRVQRQERTFLFLSLDSMCIIAACVCGVCIAARAGNENSNLILYLAELLCKYQSVWQQRRTGGYNNVFYHKTEMMLPLCLKFFLLTAHKTEPLCSLCFRRRKLEKAIVYRVLFPVLIKVDKQCIMGHNLQHLLTKQVLSAKPQLFSPFTIARVLHRRKVAFKGLL